MRRILFLLALVLGATLSAAQNPVKAQLYTRAEGDVLRAALVIEVEPGYHIYHSELGDPKAIGKPTKLAFEGSASWSAVRFPTPVPHEQSEIEGKPTILTHEGTIALYVAGRLVSGADGSDVVIKLSGLVCDASGCVPFKKTLSSEGAGDDALFAAFPADLVAPEGAAAPAADTSSAPKTEPTPSAAPAPAADQNVPREDDKLKGHADGELYTKVVDGEARAALRIAIEPRWHLYHT
ncbi:MAG: protein-disulfide reductase DsbD domain-containing protein, partial [Planctomycetota bacterium]